MTDEHDAHEQHARFFPDIMELAACPGAAASFTVFREDEDTERTFSADAMEQLHADVMVFVLSRVMRSWNASDEPPRMLTVDVRVTVT